MINIITKLWSQKWVTADNHLGHRNIILHGNRTPWIKPNRYYDPFAPEHFKFNNPLWPDIKAHDEAQTENWNERVGKNDEVKILGDFAFNNHEAYIKALNGNLVLIKGNHDDMSNQAYRLFKSVDETPEMDEIRKRIAKIVSKRRKYERKRERTYPSTDSSNVESHDEFLNNVIHAVWSGFVNLNELDIMDQMSSECYRKFKGVHEMGLRRYVPIKPHEPGKKQWKQDVTFGHYGMRTWGSSMRGSWCLYGHSHGRLPEPSDMLSFDVGVDIWDYAPIPWEVVIEKMNRIKENVQKIVDGETVSNEKFSDDPDERMLRTRRKNYDILKAVGVPIKYPEMVESK